MAKTRSQSRTEQSCSSLKPKLSQKLKQKKCKLPVIRECYVILPRNNTKDITLLSQNNTQTHTKSYNLRAKVVPTASAITERKEKASKSLKQLVALSQAALYTSKAARLWEALKKQKRDKVQVNDIVCARMAGHRPWPGKVNSFSKKGTLIEFFGTHNSGYVKQTEIIPFHLCKDVLSEYMKVPIADLCVKTMSYHLSFTKAIREVSCTENNGQ